MKLLGLLDLAAAAVLVSRFYDILIPKGVVIALAVYLLIKAVIFLADIGSFFDIVAAIVLLLSLSMVLPPFVLFAAAGLVGLKGVMSLFAA